MDSLIDLLNLKDISLSTILLICVLLYLAYNEIKKKIKEYKQEHNSELEEYHKTETLKENKEKTINDRLTDLETYMGRDYKRIQQMESHLYEVSNTLESLLKSTRTKDIEDKRNKILNAPAAVIDINRPVSAEYYNNIFNTYDEYEKMLAEDGLENGQAEFSMKLVKSSWMQRAEAGMFTEQLYLHPDDAKQKLREIRSAQHWWDEDDDNNIFSNNKNKNEK